VWIERPTDRVGTVESKESLVAIHNRFLSADRFDYEPALSNPRFGWNGRPGDRMWNRIDGRGRVVLAAATSRRRAAGGRQPATAIRDSDRESVVLERGHRRSVNAVGRRQSRRWLAAGGASD
jgi:hypothetical protein